MVGVSDTSQKNSDAPAAQLNQSVSSSLKSSAFGKDEFEYIKL